MPFITKLDFSNNRQVKQYPETLTHLSGATTFGVPFSYLPVGPDLTTSYISQTLYNLTSTFSGNSGTTVYSWSDSRMGLATSYLSALTPTISAETQNTGDVYTAATTGTSIDGYSINTSYTGVSFDLFPNYFIDLGGGNYSGTVYTNVLSILAAGALDFTGKTLWVDVSGITRTDELIISKNPQIGYAWTCADADGNGEWGPFSGVASDYWTAGTLTNSLIPINNSAGNNKIGINTDPQTVFEAKSVNGNLYISARESGVANGFQLSGNSNGFTQLGCVNYDAPDTWGIGIGAIGRTQTGYQGYGDSGTTFIYASIEANGLNIINNSGVALPYSNNDNYIRLFAGSPANSTPHMHIQGSGATKGYIALNDTSPTERLDVNGSARFRSIGSSASAGALHRTADGTLTTNTSDIRLKENITPITNALNTIKALSGVTYQWKDRYHGGDAVRIGFIAQQVEEIEPMLVFTNQVDNFKGIHTDGMIPLLVEAIKELASGSIISGSTYLETQTIVAEDNNIDLNYNGTPQTAIGGGLRVLHALGQDKQAEFLTDSEGNWVTNNDLKAKALTIPVYTPSSSSDIAGNEGNITRDDNYLYVKIIDIWKRIKFEEF